MRGPLEQEVQNETPDLTLARKILAAQPFSALLGARLTAFGDGEAILEPDIRDELLQQYGSVHGGVLGYAADNALTFGAGSVADARLITAGFTIDHLRPAKRDVLRTTRAGGPGRPDPRRLPLRPVPRRRRR